MPHSDPPVELDSLASTKRTKPSSQVRGVLIGAVIGSFTAVGLFLLLKDQFSNPPPPQQQAQTIPAADNNTTNSSADATAVNADAADPPEKSETNELALNNDELEDADSASNRAKANSLSKTEEPASDAVAESADPVDSAIPILPLDAEKPETSLIVAAAQTSSPQQTTQSSSSKKGSSGKAKEEEREDIKLSNRRWTTLVLFQKPVKGEAPIPDDFPLWNYPKGYQFKGSAHDQHRLGNFRIDGEFIIRDGYLRREFGNSALLHLPPAENFDLEGIASFEGLGGWLLLVGWDINSKSGYAIYNTKLKNASVWFAIEIKDGKPVANSERALVDRRIQGEGALRVRVENKKISMQVADAYLFRDEELPNYEQGHVAMGTFSPQYGAQNIGIKSLRMKLR